MYVETDGSLSKKLYITSIQNDDEGSFTCSAQGRGVQLSQSVQLNLFSKSISQSLDDFVCVYMFCVASSLTLWRPLMPYRYSYKASCARPGLSRYL